MSDTTRISNDNSSPHNLLHILHKEFYTVCKLMAINSIFLAVMLFMCAYEYVHPLRVAEPYFFTMSSIYLVYYLYRFNRMYFIGNIHVYVDVLLKPYNYSFATDSCNVYMLWATMFMRSFIIKDDPERANTLVYSMIGGTLFFACAKIACVYLLIKSVRKCEEQNSYL